MLEELKDVQRLPCGCIIGKHPETNAFVMNPCSETCEYFAYAVTAARKQGKPIAQLDLRDEGNNRTADNPGFSPLFNPICRYCGTKNDAYTSANKDDKPKPGDVTICAYCTRIMLYTEHGLRKPTPDEYEELIGREQIQAMIAAAKVWNGSKA